MTKHIVKRSRDSEAETINNPIAKKIENILKEYQMNLSVDQLSNGLGSQISKADLQVILKNLNDNHKITYHKGSIVWIDRVASAANKTDGIICS
jgi:galactitol-specific phosphotransferase system IIB component